MSNYNNKPYTEDNIKKFNKRLFTDFNLGAEDIPFIDY